MHVAFEALPYFHYEQTALIFGQIFYWNEEDDYFVRIADGNFFLNASPTSYGSMVGHPQFTIDDDGWMWCLYQQYGTPGILSITAHRVTAARMVTSMARCM